MQKRLAEYLTKFNLDEFGRNGIDMQEEDEADNGDEQIYTGPSAPTVHDMFIHPIIKIQNETSLKTVNEPRSSH